MNVHCKLLKGNHGFEQKFNKTSRKLGLFGTKLYIFKSIGKNNVVLILIKCQILRFDG